MIILQSVVMSKLHYTDFISLPTNLDIIKMIDNNQMRLFVFMLALFSFVASVPAQSPNTASMIVVVVDQIGAVVPDAKVSVVNNATGAVRDVVSGDDGSATVPALSLTGTYTVTVSKSGFGNEQLKDLTLRSGETATLKVKLLVGSENTQVTVYGTTEGVRADPQIGRRLDSPQIDATPIFGRKTTTLPRWTPADNRSG